MRRILYIPWTEKECTQIVTDAKLWADSYSSRQFKVERTTDLIRPQDVKVLPQTAQSKLFEVLIYDPARKEQLKALGAVTDINDVHQLYILGHCNPEISGMDIYPTRIISDKTPGLFFLDLGLRLLEHEKLPEDFNGKVKLFVCKGGIGPTPLKGNPPKDRQENSFAQVFANYFIAQRPSAKVYAYTEELVSSHPSSKQIAFKAVWDESSKMIRVGARQARVEIKKKG